MAVCNSFVQSFKVSKYTIEDIECKLGKLNLCNAGCNSPANRNILIPIKWNTFKVCNFEL